MSDFFVEVERELRAAAARGAHLPWHRRRGLRLLRHSRRGLLLSRYPRRAPWLSRHSPRLRWHSRHTLGSAGSRARLRVAVLVLVLVFATTAIALAATGVILTGAPVHPVGRQLPTVGEGVPVAGGSRLLALRAPDPAGGLPWGMRIVHTTRGLICVQVGRVDHDRLGVLGVDGAFGNDGRFHPLPADALPDVLGPTASFNVECQSPGQIFAGEINGLQLSAASDPRPGAGVAADRREISFGLLGRHAVQITYRAGSARHTRGVLLGLGAYLIVQRVTRGGRLGSISDTDGSDLRYGFPASPNGALTAITYRYAGKPCIATGNGRTSGSCGQTGPRPHVAPLPEVHTPLRVHLQIHRHVITGAVISFPAPYPVTSAGQDYFAFARTCRGLTAAGSETDVARGATVSISVGSMLSSACTRAVTVEVNYSRSVNDAPSSTGVGTVTIREPPGTHAAPLPRRRRVSLPRRRR